MYRSKKFTTKDFLLCNIIMFKTKLRDRLVWNVLSINSKKGKDFRQNYMGCQIFVFIQRTLNQHNRHGFEVLLQSLWACNGWGALLYNLWRHFNREAFRNFTMDNRKIFLWLCVWVWREVARINQMELLTSSRCFQGVSQEQTLMFEAGWNTQEALHHFEALPLHQTAGLSDTGERKGRIIATCSSCFL